MSAGVQIQSNQSLDDHCNCLKKVNLVLICALDRGIKIYKSNCLVKLLVTAINSLMLGGSKRSYLLKQTSSFNLKVCLSMHDLLLPPSIEGLTLFCPVFHFI